MKTIIHREYYMHVKHLFFFFKYGLTENSSRAREVCLHKQTMNSSCL